MATRRAAARNKAKDITADAKALAVEKDLVKLQVEDWFKKYDRDMNAVLDQGELKTLLENLSGGDPSERVMSVAWAYAKPHKVKGSTMNGVSKEAASEVVAKVLDYIKHQATIDPTFDKYDTDGNGVLDKDELLKLLQSVAAAKGVSPDTVTPNDVEEVLQMTDANGTGVIERDEVMFACARWRNKIMGPPVSPPEEKSSSVCAIL